jgi:two-component system, NarL family, invasion response regulator UvrY
MHPYGTLARLLAARRGGARSSSGTASLFEGTGTLQVNAAETTVSVMTVDDQEVFRQAARDVVEATPGFELVGEAASGEEALALVDALDPSLVLMDVRMPGMSGVEAARRMSAARPRTAIVLVTMEDPAALPADAASCGAALLVRKQEFGPALLRRVRVACGLGGS